MKSFPDGLIIFVGWEQAVNNKLSVIIDRYLISFINQDIRNTSYGISNIFHFEKYFFILLSVIDRRLILNIYHEGFRVYFYS